MKLYGQQNRILQGVKVSLELGFKVFPAVQGGKKPAIVGGFKAASKDRKRIETFFRANRRLNYGIVTGAVSGFFALDIDGSEGRTTLASHVKKHGLLPKTVKVESPHGEHDYFKTPGHPIPNSVGRVGPGVDVRADGGYGVGPGSRTPDGTYRYADGRGPEDVEIAPAPPWLLKLIGRKPVTGERDSAPPREIRADEMARAKAYAEAAFKSERERLRKAPAHQRNNTLNVCGFKLGRLVARGLLDRARVIAELTQIGEAIELDHGEIARTIDSGLKAGMSKPVRLPFEKGRSTRSEENPPSASGDEVTKMLAALGEDDIANAERFVLRYGHRVIYSESRGYLVFDGKRFRPNAHIRCVELAKDVVKKIADEAPHLGSEEARARRAKVRARIEVQRRD
jgi:hypothetical protein